MFMIQIHFCLQLACHPVYYLLGAIIEPNCFIRAWENTCNEALYQKKLDVFVHFPISGGSITLAYALSPNNVFALCK